MKHSPLRALAVVGAALVLMAGGAIAFAAIPSADGTITACMTKASGTIRLIDTSVTTNCRTGEQKVAWNQAGQPGVDGVSGYERVESRVEHVIESASTTVVYGSVRCPEGKVVVGGGATSSDFTIEAHNSAPVRSSVNGVRNEGWIAEYSRITGANFGVGKTFDSIVTVYCIDAP